MRSSSVSLALRLGISVSRCSTYFTGFKAFAFAVSMIEYKIAVGLALLAALLNNQMI
jgi:hypothetical protein